MHVFVTGATGALDRSTLPACAPLAIACSSHTTTQLTAADREQLTARSVGIVDGRSVRLVVEQDRLAGIEMDDGHVVRRHAAFVRTRFVPNVELLADLGAR
jgi:hypothetical protein